MTQTISRQYKLNYFDPSENSNKVWHGKAFADGTFRTEFGRVRDGGLGMMNREKKMSSEAAAVAELETKRLEKIKKGYRESATLGASADVIAISKPQDLHTVATAQIGGADDAATAELIKYLAEVNIHQITHSTSIKYNAVSGAFSTPLGVLTPNAVAEARNLLGGIEAANGKPANHRNRLVCDYFRLVPSDFGAKIPNVDSLLDSSDKIRKQSQILDALDAALTAAQPQAQADKIFSCRLTKVPHWTDEGKAKFREIKSLFEKTSNSGHSTSGLKLTRVYEVEIESMKKNFDVAAAKFGNVRSDLWHGTKASNLLSILKGGLQIPQAGSAHCSGRMFGNGVYTSLQSTKALNYATNKWNGSGPANQKTFMFLTEVALGKMAEPKTRTGSFPKSGSDSTWVNAGTCGVMNHECIVYSTKQINLKYLCEFGAA